MGWTSEEVSKFVKSKLGAPKRRVELDHTNINEALQRAVRQMSTVKPLYKFGSMVINKGQQKYDFVVLSLPFGKGITNFYVEPITSPSQGYFSEFEWWRLRHPPYISAGEIVLDQIYFKELGLITGTEFDWEWDRDTNVLLVTPTPNRTSKAAYIYNASPDRIEDLRPSDQGWVVDFTVAICKEMLGRVRNKFQGVPGNDLPVDTDGADLLSEGLGEQEALKGALQEGRGDWTPPIIG